MTTKIVPGSLIATPSPADVAREAATRVARALSEAVRDAGVATLALSGGSTPKDAYAALATQNLDWSHIKVFWVDERAVPKEHERSNYRLVRESLLGPANVPETNVFAMDGAGTDLDAAALAYEETIRSQVRRRHEGQPSIDVVILGIGTDGHTASLFPGKPEVHERKRLVVSVPPDGEREARLSLTALTLEHAKHTFVLAVGKDKHPPLERVWSIMGTAETTPARIIRTFKGSVAWIIDRAAGGV
jgi:6-phosphogluconolactonase